MNNMNVKCECNKDDTFLTEREMFTISVNVTWVIYYFKKCILIWNSWTHSPTFHRDILCAITDEDGEMMRRMMIF